MTYVAVEPLTLQKLRGTLKDVNGNDVIDFETVFYHAGDEIPFDELVPHQQEAIKAGEMEGLVDKVTEAKLAEIQAQRAAQQNVQEEVFAEGGAAIHTVRGEVGEAEEGVIEESKTASRKRAASGATKTKG